MNFIKRSNDDLKANRPTLEEVKFISKVPISILVEDVRVSSEGMVYAVGVDNRYNLKQYANGLHWTTDVRGKGITEA